MIKKIKLGVFLAITLLLAVFTLNVGGVTNRLVGHFFHQYVFGRNEFLIKQEALRSFEVLPDGALCALDNDPWVFTQFEIWQIYEKPLYVQIDMEYLTNEGERFTIFSVPSYNYKAQQIREGTNLIRLDFLEKDDVGIRLDLTSAVGQVMKVEQIVYNPNWYLTYQARKMFACMLAGAVFLWAVWGCSCLVSKQKKLSVALAKARRSRWSIVPKVVLFGAIALFLYFGLWEGAVVCTAGLMFISAGTKNWFAWEKGIAVVSQIVCVVFLASAAICVQNPSLRLTSSSDKIVCAFFLLCLYLLYFARTESMLYLVFFICEHAYFFHIVTRHDYAYVWRQTFNNSVIVLNCIVLVLLFELLRNLVGIRLGSVMIWFVSLLYLVSSILKFNYQGAIIRLADLRLVKELFSIAGRYLSSVQLAISVILLLLVIGIIIWFRKPVFRFLKPKISRNVLVYFGGLYLLSSFILSSGFADLGVSLKENQLALGGQIQQYGFGIFLLSELTGRNSARKPEGYNSEIVEKVEAYADGSTRNEQKPTVLLILAESFFEIEQVPDIKFDKNLLNHLGKYKQTDLLSPAYGGRTVAAEFEALTGLSSAFLEGEALAYNSYLNDTGADTGSLAREFKRNGYRAVAVHCNIENFYNRNVVYQNMDFDDFISREDLQLEDGDILGDGYVNDHKFVQTLKEQLEENKNNPVFIFGASLECHGPYANKYYDPSIQATSGVYSSEAVREAAMYAQAVYNFDAAMGELFDYLDKYERPVYVYIFGDHLPALALNSEDGYLDQVYLKYKTPFYVYTNQGESVFAYGDIMSTAQIAPRIVRDAGIDYQPYFDVIYEAGKETPVLHSELEYNREDECLQLYRMIVYDLVLGKRYLLRGEL